MGDHYPAAVPLGPEIVRERPLPFALWSVAALGCLLGLAFSPSATTDPNGIQQLVELVRVFSACALAIVLVLGPGVALRARRGASWGLGFLPLPGLALLTLVGAAAWLLGIAGWVHPRYVSMALCVPVLAWLVVELLRPRDRPLLSGGERWALLVVGAVLGIAVGRSIWSLGPVGELFGATITRTLEVGDRSDPVISYHTVQLVAQGASPFGALAHSYFLPYSFSDRGPLAGVASVPLVLITGGHPPRILASTPWTPFDAEGYMGYRIAMMTFACTSFLSLWTLVRQLTGERAARLALLLAATTPFLVHEVWFTWPKLMAASLVLLAAARLLDRRFLQCGLLVGAGYLVHPLALLSLPALLLLALWPLRGPQLTRPRIQAALLVLGGGLVCFVAWRLINWSDYTQSGFVDYIKQMGRSRAFLEGHPGPFALSAWLSDRLVSIGNTLVPLRLFFLSANDQSVNSAVQTCFPLCTGGSPGIVHFFFQYWSGVPFGMGILFFPLLLLSLWRAARRWPWAITATVVVPFLAFAAYWGDASTGLLREGLHVWVFTLLVVVAADQARRGFSWLRSRLVRAVLWSRSVEVLLVAILPAIVTRHSVVQGRFVLTDVVSLALMGMLATCLGTLVWLEPAGPIPRMAVPERSVSAASV